MSWQNFPPLAKFRNRPGSFRTVYTRSARGSRSESAHHHRQNPNGLSCSCIVLPGRYLTTLNVMSSNRRFRYILLYGAGRSANISPAQNVAEVSIRRCCDGWLVPSSIKSGCLSASSMQNCIRIGSACLPRKEAHSHIGYNFHFLGV